ncbi:autophagy-like protein 22 [Ilyonectria robusta]
MIWFIDVERGKREGAKLAETIEGFPTPEENGDDDEPESRGMLADYEEGDGRGATNGRAEN